MDARDCNHTERRDGVCVDCGHCVHELILNYRCYYCGSEDVEELRETEAPQNVVPITRLTRRER